MKRNGFTLLELLVGLGLAMLIMGFAAYGLLSQHRSLAAATNFSDANQAARLTLDQMSRELRMAGFGVIGQPAFAAANKQSMQFSGDLQANIVAMLSANANAGATAIQLPLVAGHAIVNPGDQVFLNGGGNVEMVGVPSTGTIVDFSASPATIHLATGLRNSYPAGATLVRTVETATYAAGLPNGAVTRNGVTIADRLSNLEFHYYDEVGNEMVPDPAKGLNGTQLNAIRRVELRLQAAQAASPTYSQSVDLRNMGNRPYKADSCAPNPPTGLSATKTDTCGEFGVAWTPPTTNACDGSPLTDLAGYNVYYGTSSGNYLLPPFNVSPETVFSQIVQDARLNNNATYYAAITAYDTSFNESAKSGEITLTINDTNPPGAPRGDATAGAGYVTLTWTPPSDPDVRGFRLYRSTTSPVAATQANRIADETTLTTSITSYSDANLTACQTYYYAVSAVDCANEGTPSPAIFGDGPGNGPDSPTSGATNTTPTKSPPTPPAVPSPFNSVGRYQDVDLFWTNSPDADFAGVMIRYSTTGYPTSTTSGTLAANVPGAPSAAMQYSVGGLINGTKYYFSIFAYNKCNIYSAAATTFATPGAKPPVLQIMSPANGATISNDQLVFQVAAYAPDAPGVSNPPNILTDDGKGIANVKLWVAPDPGSSQFPAMANVVQYCGFGGAANPCAPGPLDSWCDGSYALNATATDSLTGQTATSYVTVTIDDGGLYNDTTVAPAVSGTYSNVGSFGWANDSANSAVIAQTLQFSWNYVQAALRQIEAPAGTVIWSASGAPVASGTTITLPTNGQPTLPANGKLGVVLTFTQLSTNLTSSAGSGAKALQTQSASGFLQGDPVYITDGVNADSNVVASISGATINLTNALVHTYAAGTAVRHRANADDMNIHGMQLTGVYGYQKSAIVGRTCTSNQAQVTFLATPLISAAEQDLPAANTLCTTVQAANKVNNYYPVPTHIVIADQSGKGIAGGTAYYYVDSAFQAVAPMSGYTSVAMTYDAAHGTWDGTIPASHATRIWLYFGSLDNGGNTDRSPESGAYSYDYITDTTIPPCPTGLAATLGGGNGTINLSWNAATVGDFAGYSVYRQQKGSGSGYSKIASGVTTTTYSDTNGLKTNKNCYDYYVTAVDMSGNESTGCTVNVAGAGAGACP